MMLSSCMGVYLTLLNTSEYHFFAPRLFLPLKVSEANKVISTQTVFDLCNQRDSKDICNLGLQLHNCISSNVRECEF